MNKENTYIEEIHKKPIPVAFSCDDNYTKHLYCAITSIISNKDVSDEFVFYVLIDTLNDSNKKALEGLCDKYGIEINFIKINKEDFKNCPITKSCPHISIATYYRFILPSVLQNLDKLIYLDCDITVQKSIRELYDIDISDYYFGAVKDILFSESTKRLNVEKYCNAGIMLINLKKWREEDIEQKLFDWAKNNIDKIKCVDQDVLNYVMQDGIKYIDLKFNCQVGSYDVCYKEGFNQNAKNACILHHIGVEKPWSRQCKSPLRFQYYKYLLKTPYKACVFEYLINQLPFMSFFDIKKWMLIFRMQCDWLFD